MSVVTGRVSAWNSTTRIATIVGHPGPVPVLRHVTAIAVGDTAVVQVEGGQAWVIGVLGIAPPPAPETRPPDVAPPTVPPTGPTSVTLRPSWSGSWRGGAWRSDTSDLYQGDYTGRGINTGGCWWDLPAGVTSAVLTTVRGQGGAGAATAPTMALLAGSGPAGAPAILATAAGPALLRGESADWVVPVGWIPQLASGAAEGIGITSGGSKTPYLVLIASGVGMTLTVSTT